MTEQDTGNKTGGNLDAFQAEVGQWAEATFTQATMHSIRTHLAREVEELRAADAGGPHAWELASEAADCLLLLLHLAHRANFSLLEAAQAKHQHNRQRTWGQPDAEGVVEHQR